MTNDELLIRSIQNVLNVQLGLLPAQELLVVFEDATQNLAQAILHAAALSSINTTLLYTPKSFQQQHNLNAELPAPMGAAARMVDALITCVSASPELTRFRSKLIDMLNYDLAIGHTPGIDIDMIRRYFSFDPGIIQQRCEFLVLPLAKGQSIEIHTVDAKGKTHILSAGLGGWERLPIVSSGQVPKGSWGNLLPGETYIAPVPATASGTIVINGSLPGLRLDTQELVLQFENGTLTKYSASAPHVLKHFEATCKSIAVAQDDANWVQLCEIGIGVNSTIETLTGISVIDEKSYRTAHIALGDNIGMGGTIESAVHYDMVFCNATILIDSKTLLENGEVDWSSKQWVFTFDTITPPDSWNAELDAANFIERPYAQLDDDIDHLCKLVTNGAHKKLRIDLGNTDLSRSAKQLLSRFSTTELNSFNLDHLAEVEGLAPETLGRLLYYLNINGLIRLIK